MIITVAHQKGGTGKSTIAVNVAVAMHADLLDLDKQHSSIIFNYNRKQAGLPELTCFTVAESRCRFREQTPVPQDNLDDLMQDYAGVPGKDLIIDCGGFDSQNNRGALCYADYIVTPLAPSGTEIYGLQMFGEILVETGQMLDTTLKTHVLINNADLRSRQRIRDLQEFVQSRPDIYTLCQTIVGSRQAFKTAYEEGKSVTELYEAATAKKEKRRYQYSAQELDSLVQEIRSTLPVKEA